MIAISSIIDNLSATYKVFRKVIIDNNTFINTNEVGWKNYRPGIPKLVYSRQYEDLIRFRQFSFLLKDKSAIQLVYKYDDKGLEMNRLALYPFPKTINIDEDKIEEYIDESLTDALETHYILLHDLMGQNISVSNTTHVRFDYDRDVTSHSVNHLQIDGIQDLRVPFARIISPFHFVDFIVQHLFPDEYNEIIKTEAYIHLASSSVKQQSVVEIGKEYSSIFLSL